MEKPLQKQKADTEENHILYEKKADARAVVTAAFFVCISAVAVCIISFISVRNKDCQYYCFRESCAVFLRLFCLGMCMILPFFICFQQWAAMGELFLQTGIVILLILGGNGGFNVTMLQTFTVLLGMVTIGHLIRAARYCNYFPRYIFSKLTVVSGILLVVFQFLNVTASLYRIYLQQDADVAFWRCLYRSVQLLVAGSEQKVGMAGEMMLRGSFETVAQFLLWATVIATVLVVGYLAIVCEHGRSEGMESFWYACKLLQQHWTKETKEQQSETMPQMPLKSPQKEAKEKAGEKEEKQIVEKNNL